MISFLDSSEKSEKKTLRIRQTSSFCSKAVQYARSRSCQFFLGVKSNTLRKVKVRLFSICHGIAELNLSTSMACGSTWMGTFTPEFRKASREYSLPVQTSSRSLHG